jgi:hypothetical protein
MTARLKEQWPRASKWNKARKQGSRSRSTCSLSITLLAGLYFMRYSLAKSNGTNNKKIAILLFLLVLALENKN